VGGLKKPEHSDSVSPLKSNLLAMLTPAAMATSMSAKADQCPLCKKAVRAEFAPFCSVACQDRDLVQWLSEGYRVPGKAIDEDSGISGLDSDD
jgi:uncharacterized protein